MTCINVNRDSTQLRTGTGGPPARISLGSAPLDFDLAGQLDGSGTGGIDGASGPLHLVIWCARRPQFVGRHPFGDTVGEPFSDRYRLSIGIGEGLDHGFDAVGG